MNIKWVVEIWMLRWMFDHTRKDKILNDHIREQVGVTPFTEKIV